MFALMSEVLSATLSWEFIYRIFSSLKGGRWLNRPTNLREVDIMSTTPVFPMARFLSKAQMFFARDGKYTHEALSLLFYSFCIRK